MPKPPLPPRHQADGIAHQGHEAPVLPEFVRVIGKRKYWVKGDKRYAPVIAIGNHGFYLRVHWPTATDALEYGEKMVARYQRLLRLQLQAEGMAHQRHEAAMLRAYVEPEPVEPIHHEGTKGTKKSAKRSWWWRRVWAWLKRLVNHA